MIPSDVDVEARLQPPSVRLWNLTGFSGHMCGLETDGRAHCWMDPDLDAYALRAPSEEPFLSISAGGGHTCGVFQTGEVECLGDGVPNEAEVESWFGEGAAVIGISTAATQACIWTEAGQAACWGLNERAEDWIVPTSVR